MASSSSTDEKLSLLSRVSQLDKSAYYAESPVTANNLSSFSTDSSNTITPEFILDSSGIITKKKAWTSQEDTILTSLVEKFGTQTWTEIAQRLPNRSGKQCRERWHNHLDPGIKKGEWTEEEDRIIVEMQQTYGNQWAKITKLLPGRTDNAVKNRFHAVERARIRNARMVTPEAFPIYFMKKRKFFRDEDPDNDPDHSQDHDPDDLQAYHSLQALSNAIVSPTSVNKLNNSGYDFSDQKPRSSPDNSE